MDDDERLRALETTVAVLRDRMEDVRDELTALAALPTEMGRLARSTEECAEVTGGLRDELERRRVAREREQEKRVERMSEERERAKRDRRSDRRWLVGTGLTTTTVVIAAVALLADKV